MSNAKPSKPTNENVNRLLSIMARLRGVDGCPWDQKQTMASLTSYTLEEAYEVVDAIAGGEPKKIRDELGDLLFQVVFYSQIAQEQGQFDFEEVAGAIADKMTRRHPHVFADKKINEDELSEQWRLIKAREKTDAGERAQQSIFDAVPSGLPALMLAQKLQEQCAQVGFDWGSAGPVLEKVREEVDEIENELLANAVSQTSVEEEIGDALFAMVNLARHCNVNADDALRRASHKFAGRFRQIESRVKADARSLPSLSLDELEHMWQSVKATEKTRD